MNSDIFVSKKCQAAEWRVEKGRFSTWKANNFYWHGLTKHDISDKVVFVFSENIESIPKKKIWYLTGLRQLIWRRSQKIKGFIPFVGIDIVKLQVVVVLYQIRPLKPNLNVILTSILESRAYSKLKSKVC